ncbi:unnamed protein product [Ceratitis capitata]|uniref:(Mediterranean fruit fly) hypothetical protein n=1 Tax=Ceratitis capitata TaxID=7213 RepID=A0A811VE88_CERCA|nr:unnamed protein product [Ceratitis capitata]
MLQAPGTNHRHTHTHTHIIIISQHAPKIHSPSTIFGCSPPAPHIRSLNLYASVRNLLPDIMNAISRIYAQGHSDNCHCSSGRSAAAADQCRPRKVPAFLVIDIISVSALYSYVPLASRRQRGSASCSYVNFVARNRQTVVASFTHTHTVIVVALNLSYLFKSPLFMLALNVFVNLCSFLNVIAVVVFVLTPPTS